MKKEFKAEARKVMQLMINSIYTNKEVFLREIISNASDALDKRYYNDLNSDKEVNKDDYYIEIKPDKDNRTLTISDTGIGMDESELESNLGTIATSGTEKFRKNLEESNVNDLIGQFGVGFYSAFMVSDKVEVISNKNGKSFKWVSEDADGFEISSASKSTPGTDIILYLKNNNDDDDFDSFLDEYTLESLITKYSNYIRYPIYMDVTKTRKKDPEDENSEYENYKEREVINSKEPIWKKSKKDLTDEDYINFYRDEHFGFDEPLSWLHLSIEGLVAFKAILYIPKKAPFDFYSKDYKRGLTLYSNGVKIMDRCEDLLDDSFAFVKGVVDSEDVSLNISRETLQVNRQLKFIAKQINNKIKAHLSDLLEKDRDKYYTFFDEFGNQMKMSLYESYGMKKDQIQDLLIFNSKNSDNRITLKEYVEKMPSTQEKIFYTVGDSIDKIKTQPSIKTVDDNVDVLYLIDKLDEFLIKMLRDYDGKSFESITEETSTDEDSSKEEMFNKMKDILPDEVVEIRKTDKLEDDPVILLHRGDISIEMEKTFKNQTNTDNVKAQKVLELNEKSKAYKLLEESFENDNEKFEKLTKTLFDQAKILSGLEIDNPAEYIRNMWELVGE